MLRAVSLLALASCAAASQAALTVYTDRSAFEAVLAAFATQTFSTDASLAEGDNLYGGVNYRVANAGPDFSVSSGAFNGLEGYGPKYSRSRAPSLDVVFSAAVTAFGADFSSVNTGTGLRLSILGQSVDLSNYLATPGNGFVGIVSDQAFTTVDFRSEGLRQPSFFAEDYAFDNLTYDVAAPVTPSVPSPAAALPFALMALKRRKRA